jgi:GTP cyclohydrolase I
MNKIPSNILENTNNECQSQNENDKRTSKLAELIKEMLLILNPHAEDEILSKTPLRYAEAMMELTESNRKTYLEPFSEAIFESEGYDDMIVVKDINFNSICEHHLLPFFGHVSIGYLPNKKIFGLSKFPRLVQLLSKKMTIQERLTKEIADNINSSLDAQGVVVRMSSTHSCMCFRGIKSFNSKTETIYSIGQMKIKENLDKFFKLLNIN